jgi:hypothetical protein
MGSLLSAEPAFVVAGRESSKMVRYLLAASAAGGADAVGLAKNLGLPGWILQRDEVMISPDFALRLWELAEHALEVPDLAITFAQRYQPGELDLYDYLFTTAPTLRYGFDLSARYLYLLTTNGRLDVEAETDREVTYSYRYLAAAGPTSRCSCPWRYFARGPGREPGSRSSPSGSPSGSGRPGHTARSRRLSARSRSTSTRR